MLNPRIAEALGIPRQAGRETLSARLAELGGFANPVRPQTAGLLISILDRAIEEIPNGAGAWSWGEFHHGGLYPTHALIQIGDAQGLADCAVDLGLVDRSADLSPAWVGEALMDATNRLLRALERELTKAGISPYGHAGLS